MRTPGQAPEQEGINGTGGDFTLLELARYTSVLSSNQRNLLAEK